MAESVHERLEGVFREVFADPGLELTAETTADDIDGWDSLAHINLIFRVEQEFGVRLAGDEGASLANVGELERLLGERTGLPR